MKLTKFQQILKHNLDRYLENSMIARNFMNSEVAQVKNMSKQSKKKILITPLNQKKYQFNLYKKFRIIQKDLI